MEYVRARASQLGRSIIAWLLLAVVFSACEAPSTPIPVGASTPLPPTEDVIVVAPTLQSTLSIGIASTTADYLDNLERLQEVAQVNTFDDLSQAQAFDLAISYGAIDGWQQASSQDIILVMNTQLAPLNQPEIVQIIQQSIDTQQVINVVDILGVEALYSSILANIDARNQLANLGYPDGLQLSAFFEASPALEAIGDSLRQRNIRLNLTPLQSDVEAVLSQNLAHLIFLHRPTEDFQANNALPLLRIPISYRTSDELPLSFSPMGFPQPQS